MVVFDKGPGEGPLLPVYGLRRIFETLGGRGLDRGGDELRGRRFRGKETRARNWLRVREKACTLSSRIRGSTIDSH